MCRTHQPPEPDEEHEVNATDAVFTSLLEDSAEELYEQAPCGYLSTLMDGTIAKINTTLLDWLGLERSRVVGGMRFADLLTVGGKLYHETHFAPLLQMQGEVSGIAMDIKAAAVTSLTRYTLRAAALHEGDPVTVLTTLNTVLHERYSSGDTRFCTAIFGVLEPDDGHVGVHLASGGHPSALIQRADGTADYLPTPGGMLIGVLPQAQFTAARARLLPGDTLLLYTDGLTEARIGPGRELYGEDALRTFTAAQPPAGPQALITALTALLAGFGEGLDDDTALLALGVPALLPTPASESLT
ncbi:PP2C family protein-serine/threonine phosphatase [Streptomyces sp. NPDC056121]|uniref:PP2C family protein-serine/threonine phosphatase n=1 Tax=Streptomyces sp. NPDC056121 TaxID=3345718 RepID=UPI0035E1F84C